ncbi:hypothetical protein [Paenibacillus sp. FSL R7-0333]|uniref:hypothetical protein n=1 Tax=Paenibacillus sp. FSL R7-0333 TaxID=1926587 RepID=UPI00096F4979|nr:hypothetical protein BK146_27240 [Paenibacillus sp. FSL R7-0333]
MLNEEALWWGQVSGPSRYLQDAFEAVSNGGVTILEETTYMDQFFSALKDKLLYKNSKLQIINCNSIEFSHLEDIGGYLLQKYAPDQNYHPMEGPPARIIAKNNLLNGRVLIVRQIEKDKRWADIATEFAKYCSLNSGSILFTISEKTPQINKQKKISVLELKKYITAYDMQLFASYCISDRSNLSFMMKNYIAQIASNLANSNPELCKELAVEELADDVFGLLSRLAQSRPHVAVISESKSHVEQILWEAQIQTVFPIIEQERRKIIDSYYQEFLNILPVTDEFGRKIDLPEDLELRHIRYYYLKINGGFRSKEDNDTFNLIYKSRNDLAHLNLLSGQVIKSICALKSDKILRKEKK